MVAALSVTVDPNGNRTTLDFPNATSTTWTYDDLNRLTDLTTTGPLGTVFSQAFTLGNAGNRTQIIENDGTTKDYTYDDLYRLTQDKVTGSLGLVYQKDFTYDDVGNRLTQVTTGQGAASVGYTYDSRDRLLTENAQSLTYDDNGNLTAKVGETTYAWDHENRLVQVTKADGTVVQHVYDPDGNRVQTTTTSPGGPATVTNFLVDTSGALSHVVAETDGTGALGALYVRGDDLLAVMRPDGSGGWNSRFFHTDGLGSIRRLTKEDGIITDGYTYSAFGELLGHTGTDPQPYAFTGEPLDPNSGFQYHRARWLDSRPGRFVGMDPFAGVIGDPQSLHRYLYAYANPVGNVDRSGEFPTIAQSMAVGALIGITASFAVPASSTKERVTLALLGGTLGAVGGGLYAGATLGAVAVTLTGSSVWILDPILRGRVIERALGANLPFNYPVIDRMFAGIATSIKSLDLASKTYQNIPALTSTVRGYIDVLATWRGSGAWGGMPAIPAALVRGRELVLAVPAVANAAQQQALAQLQLYASHQGVQMAVVTVR